MLVKAVEDKYFNIAILNEASLLIHEKKYTQLTDGHLSHVAVYDYAGAQRAARERDAQTLERAKKWLPAAPAAQRPVAPTMTEAQAVQILEDIQVAWAAAVTTGDTVRWDALVQKHQHEQLSLGALDILVCQLMFSMNDKNRARNAVIATLEERVKTLEARPVPREYCGAWDISKDYERGDFVTQGGGMWFAQRPSRGQKPGESSAWVLAVARGRDGKDAR
jgi:hypothetical protein